MLKITIIYNSKSMDAYFDGVDIPTISSLLETKPFVEKYSIGKSEMVCEATIREEDFDLAVAELSEHLILEPEYRVLSL